MHTRGGWGTVIPRGTIIASTGRGNLRGAKGFQYSAWKRAFLFTGSARELIPRVPDTTSTLSGAVPVRYGVTELAESTAAIWARVPRVECGDDCPSTPRFKHSFSPFGDGICSAPIEKYKTSATVVLPSTPLSAKDPLSPSNNY